MKKTRQQRTLIVHPSFYVKPLAALFGCLVAVTLPNAAELTLCKDKETPIFSCKLKNAKTVSICASSGSNGSVDYRYGTSSKVELTYSANSRLPEQKFHRGEVVYANNSDDVIWFTISYYRYDVYTPMRGAPGLSVSLHNDVVSRIECRSNGRGAIEASRTPSPFIIEHGTGDLATFEAIWGKR